MSARGRLSSRPRSQLPEDRVATSRQERKSWPQDQHAPRHFTRHRAPRTPPARPRRHSPRARHGISICPVVVISTICLICIFLCMRYLVPHQHLVTSDVLREELGTTAPCPLQSDVTRVLAPLPSRLGEAFTEMWFQRQDGGEAGSVRLEVPRLSAVSPDRRAAMQENLDQLRALDEASRQRVVRPRLDTSSFQASDQVADTVDRWLGRIAPARRTLDTVLQCADVQAFARPRAWIACYFAISPARVESAWHNILNASEELFAVQLPVCFEQYRLRAEEYQSDHHSLVQKYFDEMVADVAGVVDSSADERALDDLAPVLRFLRAVEGKLLVRSAALHVVSGIGEEVGPSILQQMEHVLVEKLFKDCIDVTASGDADFHHHSNGSHHYAFDDIPPTLQSLLTLRWYLPTYDLVEVSTPSVPITPRSIMAVEAFIQRVDNLTAHLQPRLLNPFIRARTRSWAITHFAHCLDPASVSRMNASDSSSRLDLLQRSRFLHFWYNAFESPAWLHEDVPQWVGVLDVRRRPRKGAVQGLGAVGATRALLDVDEKVCFSVLNLFGRGEEDGKFAADEFDGIEIDTVVCA